MNISPYFIDTNSVIVFINRSIVLGLLLVVTVYIVNHWSCNYCHTYAWTIVGQVSISMLFIYNTWEQFSKIYFMLKLMIFEIFNFWSRVSIQVCICIFTFPCSHIAHVQRSHFKPPKETWLPASIFR